MGRKQEDFLPGTPVHGYYGVLMLPPANEEPSPVVAESLALAAKDLKSDRNRRPRFMELVRSLQTAFPRDNIQWDRDLIFMADAAGWPRWACSCVNMFPRFTDRSDVGMPAPVAQAIRSAFGVQIDQELWSGCLARMTLRGEALVYYERVRDEFTGNLARMQKQTEYRSDHAWVGLFDMTFKRSLNPQWSVRPSQIESSASFPCPTLRPLNLGYSPADQFTH
jgi:hypothetical protein